MIFERTTIPGDRPVSGYVCACDKCNETDTIRATGFTRSLPVEVTRKKFIRRGWKITSRLCRCPRCS